MRKLAGKIVKLSFNESRIIWFIVITDWAVYFVNKCFSVWMYINTEKNRHEMIEEATLDLNYHFNGYEMFFFCHNINHIFEH